MFIPCPLSYAPTRRRGSRRAAAESAEDGTSKGHHEPAPEAARERISALSAAILRINASLDVDTVLREVVDSARALTGARLGAITTLDDTGRPLGFVTSGLEPGQHRALMAWPDGPQLFDNLRNLAAPLRLADLGAWIRTLGHSPFPVPCGTFQATPMRHRGRFVGTFFLGGKEGAFTDEDEEVLVLFASQAATALTNARAHRDERRARADLEALVETAPVGVVVFDAGSGRPLSLNREARRVVAGLHMPGRSEAELAEVLTCRRADGREATLDQLRNAEALRAEEVELSVPDGRSVRTLINATPIRSAAGEVETVVVTVQDLTPFEALERSRAEFWSMVSHELRAPMAAIKGSAATVLGAVRDLEPAELLQFFRIVDEQADRVDGLIGDLLDAGRIATGTLPVAPEPADVAALVERARTTFLSGGGRHAVLIDLPEDLPPAMADGRRIVQVLDNLFTNAARHAPETSPIRVAAARDGVHVAVSVADEGEGMEAERLAQLFSRHAGMSGGDGGTGLGLSICKGLVEAHGGRIRAESGGPGRGMCVTFALPLAGEGDVESAAAAAGADASRQPREGRERTSVLVVDDDPQTLHYARDALAAAGYAPVVTGDPQDVEGLVRTKKPALVLLDMVLPGTDGIALMEGVSALADLPVIFISAYGRDETVARALEAGAADYIVKPFSPTELTARVRAALRRRSGPEPFILGDLSIDYGRRRVSVAGRPVRLTATEYELLRLLSVNAGRVATYDALLRQVWGEKDTGDPEPVRNFVRKLRRKLGDDAAGPRYILNERGVGYRMPEPGGP